MTESWPRSAKLAIGVTPAAFIEAVASLVKLRHLASQIRDSYRLFILGQNVHAEEKLSWYAAADSVRGVAAAAGFEDQVLFAFRSEVIDTSGRVTMHGGRVGRRTAHHRRLLLDWHHAPRGTSPAS